jgi:hypothetical protein
MLQSRRNAAAYLYSTSAVDNLDQKLTLKKLEQPSKHYARNYNDRKTL